MGHIRHIPVTVLSGYPHLVEVSCPEPSDSCLTVTLTLPLEIPDKFIKRKLLKKSHHSPPNGLFASKYTSLDGKND